MKITKYIISIIVLVVLASCTSIKLERLSSESKINKAGIVYTLPKTKLNIIAEVVKTTYYKGPFSEYADEYLGFDNVIKSNFSEYKLSSINIVPTIENDNDYTYLLTNYSKNIKSVSYFDGTNVLSAFNTVSTEGGKADFEVKKFKINKNYIPFKDRTVKPLVVEKSDTVWKTILVDSVFKRIPKVNTAIAPRTIKEQAYMASRFILKIRKRRLRVLTAMDGKFPNGNALKKIVKELDRLENTYLNLFTGKVIYDTAKYVFAYTPDTSLVQNNLFNFDSKKGVSENSKYSVSINFIDDSKNEYFQKINSLEIKKCNLVYKTAKFINAEIKLNNSIIFSKEIPVYQVGLINNLPLKQLKNKIVFDKIRGNYNIQE